MKRGFISKTLALWMTALMLLQLPVSNGIAFAGTTPRNNETIQSFSVAPGSAQSHLEFYVGGPEASAANDGLTAGTPVLSLKEVTDELNLGDGGSYTIHVLGDVTVDEEIVIGNGTDDIQVTLLSATGSAILLRDPGYTNGDLMRVTSQGTLILGSDDPAAGSNELVLDGGYNAATSSPTVTGRLISIESDANVNMFSHTILQNNVGPSSAPSAGDDPMRIGGAVYNEGTFYMFGGEIRNNYCINGGGIVNLQDFLLSGGSIHNNSATSGGGIYNEKTIGLNGGNINSNTATNGGGIYNSFSNSGIYMLSGTVISYNTASNQGGGIYLDGYIRAEGGSISDNTAADGGAVYVKHYMGLSGDILIPKGTSETNDIYVEGYLYLMGNLTAPDLSMAITPGYLITQYPLIYATNETVLQDDLSVFDLTINNYELVPNLEDLGAYLRYNGTTETYYIDGADGNDTNDGSVASPFKTIEAALLANYIEDQTRECTLVFQDDILLTNQITITGRVNMISDGISTHNITASNSLTGNMFRVDGGLLTLGSNTASDDTNRLVLRGSGSALPEEAIYVCNYGTLNLFEGADIKEYGGQAIVNDSYVNLYGGNISGCSDDITVYNAGDFTISGGTIQTSRQIGIYNDYYVLMTGGTISGYTSAGINNNGGVGLSGSPIISSGVTGTCSIYNNNNYSNIIIRDALASGTSIIIDTPVYDIGGTVINANTNELLAAHAGMFSMKNPHYGITREGKLEYTAPIIDYYVDETLSTNGNGTLESPCNSFKAALQTIKSDDNIGRLILKSDISIHETVTIDGTIELLSDGQVRTIRRADDFTSATPEGELILVTGYLTLGNRNGSGSDANPTLIFDGGYLQNPSFTQWLLISNLKKMDIYPGVVLENNNSNDYHAEGAALFNSGNLTMQGGVVRNNIGSYGGVYSETGKFTMNGGTIINNKGTFSSGLYVHYSEATMNGGTISGNDGFYAGVYLNQGKFTMNDGTISNNISDGIFMYGVAGVAVTYESEFTMNGGAILNNTASTNHRYAGVYVQGKTYSGYIADSFFTMNGGRILQNSGYAAGVYSDEYSYFNMTGGQVGQSEGVLQGISVYDNGAFTLGQAAMLYNDDAIILNDGVAMGIQSKLTTDMLITLTYADLDQTYTTLPVPAYVIGTHLINSNNQYNYSMEDIDKFILSDPAYSINQSGNIGYTLQPTWVRLSDHTNVIYDGAAKTISVALFDGNQTLTQNVDYSVTYTNNTNPGTAQVILRGIGDYAGNVTSSFVIQKPVVKKILTANPANQTFQVSDDLTVEELLASITLTTAEVETAQGTTLTLPVTWSLTGGVYNSRGGTYTYTGTLVGGTSVDTNGMTLTTQIKVSAGTPTGIVVINAGTGSAFIPVDITYYSEDEEFYIDVNLAQNTVPSGSNIKIPLTAPDITNQIKNTSADRINIMINLPSSMLVDRDLDITKLLLTADMLKIAKEAGKDITISICDETGRQRYSWTFTAVNLTNSKQKLIDVNLFLKVSSLSDNKDLVKLLEDGNASITNSLVINFEQEGVLPCQAGVKLYVGDQPGITAGSKVYLYHYNQNTAKLETLPFSNGYIVGEDGYITIDIVHCSDYVFLDSAATGSVITPIKDQITVSVSKTKISIAGTKKATANILLNLPSSLELVGSLTEKTSGSSIGAVTVSYRSGNKKVATVDKNGVITAQGTGKVTIYTTIKLYNGKSKTFKSTITVIK